MIEIKSKTSYTTFECENCGIKYHIPTEALRKASHPKPVYCFCKCGHSRLREVR